MCVIIPHFCVIIPHFCVIIPHFCVNRLKKTSILWAKKAPTKNKDSAHVQRPREKGQKKRRKKQVKNEIFIPKKAYI